jgi:sensor c-di-GMP phosphodiesterase-like protein
MYSELDIYNGLLNNEFFLEYLPVSSLANEQCVGAEALIRWRKGDRVIPPLEFIPMVEGTLSGLITYWVIDKVAEELGQWLHKTPGVTIGINVPPELFGRGGMLYAVHKSHLIDVVDKIVIEIAERGVPDKLGVDAINKKDQYANVQIALDDVLSREANLAILIRLHIEIIKIDKSFTDRILHSDWPTAEDERLLRLLKETHFTVVAEGVEQRRQAEVLRDAGIPLAQGWYFSRPLEAAKFKDYFASHAISSR